MEEIIIRKGVESDVPQVLGLIKELAAYERALESVTITEEQLLRDGFGSEPIYKLLVAVKDQHIIGISLFYFRYSTWKGKGIYLEDLVVKESFRRKGIGRLLLIETAKFARKNDCTGLYWQVLDWNTPAIEFYKKLGSEFDGEWINCKLDKKALGEVS